ncbi:MAG: winged helix-turn-helix domain-containing protein [Candidatus Diapherotrites archaeon]
MYWLLSGSKGSVSRLKILKALQKKPMNIHSISQFLGLNYKTVQHHIDLLLENNFISKTGNKYGQLFFWSEQLKSKNDLFKRILEENDLHEEEKQK